MSTSVTVRSTFVFLFVGACLETYLVCFSSLLRLLSPWGTPLCLNCRATSQPAVLSAATASVIPLKKGRESASPHLSLPGAATHVQKFWSVALTFFPSLTLPRRHSPLFHDTRLVSSWVVNLLSNLTQLGRTISKSFSHQIDSTPASFPTSISVRTAAGVPSTP